MFAYTEFGSGVYIACHRNADRPLHLLQGWITYRSEADFTSGLR